MVRWLISTGPLGVRELGGQPTRPVADFVCEVAAALVEQHDAVQLLFTERAPNRFEVPWLEERGISWCYWGHGRPTTVRHAAVLAHVLRSWRPDATMFEFGGVSLGITCSWAQRVPIRIARYLTAMDAMRYDGQSTMRARVWRRRFLYRCASHIVVNARPLRDEVTAIYGVPIERVLLQLQGVERPTRSPLSLAERSRDLVCVGRLARTKGQHVLIEALGLLRRRGIEACVHFIGEGDQFSLRGQARAEGVSDLCIFHGGKPRQDVYAFLSHHAIAVQPSLADALPQSAQEAVVCGAVLVASRVGGIPDIIQDGVTGVLVPAGRADVLADVLHLLLRDESRLRSLSESAAAAADRVAMDRRAPLEAGRLHRIVYARGTDSNPNDLEIPE